LADAVILLDVVGERLRVRVPPRRPLFGDAEANADRMYLLTHTLLVAYSDGDVTVALHDAVAASLGASGVARKERRTVDLNVRHLQLVDIGAVVVLGVGDRRLEHLVHHARGLLAAERENLQRIRHGLAADLVRHEAALLR